jgi:hypothetical protein
MFIYLRTKFHMSVSNNLLLIAFKTKGYMKGSHARHIIISRSNKTKTKNLTKVAYFGGSLTIYYYTIPN